MMDFVICVPARYQSTRLPGKPLIKLKGRELILWALESAAQLGGRQLVVATDDERIEQLVQSHGYQVVMTDPDLASGTDRIAACAAEMGWADNTWVLNYQGDEPMIPKANVQQVLQVLEKHPDASIGTLYQPITGTERLFDPNVVKVVTDQNDHALYFSRAPIPYAQGVFNDPDNTVLPANQEYKHHIGLYVYKVGFLKRFARNPAAGIEQVESLEQLRAMAMGDEIVVARAVEAMPHGIDTPEDVLRFEQSAD